MKLDTGAARHQENREALVMAAKAKSAGSKTKQFPKANEEDVAASYEAFKEFEGKRYTGMKVGRSHKWYYEKGEWKEKKITPDEWEIHYSVKKRRAGHAPEGSG